MIDGQNVETAVEWKKVLSVVEGHSRSSPFI